MITARAGTAAQLGLNPNLEAGLEVIIDALPTGPDEPVMTAIATRSPCALWAAGRPATYGAPAQDALSIRLPNFPLPSKGDPKPPRLDRPPPPSHGTTI